MNKGLYLFETRCARFLPDKWGLVRDWKWIA